MPSHRVTPSSQSTGKPFELPIRAVLMALETIESLGPNAAADEIFRAGRRLSAATGFLARELNAADQAARLRQGIPVVPRDDVQIVHEEVVKRDTQSS